MLNLILNNINVWNLNKNIAKFLYFIFNFVYRLEFHKKT